MQNNVNSNISWYEGHTITSLGKILTFSNSYVQNIWQVVRWWHHQLTHLHIHIDWSRNVLWTFAKLESVITSLFFNRFSSGFHCYVWKFLLFFLKFKLNLFRISPLINTIPSVPKKKLTLLNILPNKKCETFSGNFLMCGWLRVSSIIWHQKIWK